NSINVNPLANATYTVTVTSSLSCSSVESIDVIVNDLPIISTSNDTTVCAGDTITITSSSNAANTVWNTGSTSTSITVSPAQNSNYVILATSNLGCLISDTINITVENALPISIGNDILLNDVSLQSVTYDAGNGFISYLWNNNTINQTITINYDPLKSGAVDTISVIATSISGCKSFDTAFVTYDIPSGLEGFDLELFEFMLYPNPTKGEVTLAFGSFIPVTSINVYDINSRLVHQQLINENLDSVNMNLFNLNPGVYFIQVNSNQKALLKRIIIQ
ncbi:MAG: T9SS type A sorting domain-containing protein, partial [Salibacteraceae bacterium]